MPGISLSTASISIMAGSSPPETDKVAYADFFIYAALQQAFVNSFVSSAKQYEMRRFCKFYGFFVGQRLTLRTKVDDFAGAEDVCLASSIAVCSGGAIIIIPGPPPKGRSSI